MKYTLAQLKAKMAAEWTANNPVLAAGVPGFELDTYKFKIGDGSTQWTNLAYFQISVGSVGWDTRVLFSNNGAIGNDDNFEWDHINHFLSIGAGNIVLTAAGAVTAVSFNSTSSRKLKKNIKPFKKNALAIINSVNVKEFNFKKDKEKAYRVGFIADDTDPILAGKNRDKFDLNNTIGVLLRAVQELSTKVEKLEKEKVDGRA